VPEQIGDEEDTYDVEPRREARRDVQRRDPERRDERQERHDGDGGAWRRGQEDPPGRQDRQQQARRDRPREHGVVVADGSARDEQQQGEGHEERKPQRHLPALLTGDPRDLRDVAGDRPAKMAAQLGHAARELGRVPEGRTIPFEQSSGDIEPHGGDASQHGLAVRDVPGDPILQHERGRSLSLDVVTEVRERHQDVVDPIDHGPGRSRCRRVHAGPRPRLAKRGRALQGVLDGPGALSQRFHVGQEHVARRAQLVRQLVERAGRGRVELAARPVL
jgi:hypothetical protein